MKIVVTFYLILNAIQNLPPHPYLFKKIPNPQNQFRDIPITQFPN